METFLLKTVNCGQLCSWCSVSVLSDLWFEILQPRLGNSANHLEQRLKSSRTLFLSGSGGSRPASWRSLFVLKIKNILCSFFLSNQAGSGRRQFFYKTHSFLYKNNVFSFHWMNILSRSNEVEKKVISHEKKLNISKIFCKICLVGCFFFSFFLQTKKHVAGKQKRVCKHIIE